MRKHRVLISFLLLLAPTAAHTAPVCDVSSYGAKGDGLSLDTVPMTKAIADCARQGGGTVYFSPGRYVIGTVQLQSHIRLQLEGGAVLEGSHNIRDYLPSAPLGFGRHYGVDLSGEGFLLGMLLAKDVEDVSIEGHGEIDGEGDTFMQLTTPHDARDYDARSTRDPAKFAAAMQGLDWGPYEPGERPGTMVIFYHARNVHITGVTLRSAPNWTLHLQDVQGASISGIQILNNLRIPNNGGIDCMQCHDVHISDSTIHTGDDDFAIVNSEHINVSNCSLISRSAAIRLESTQLSTFTGPSMDTNRGIAIFANGYPNQADRPTDNVIFSDIAIRTRLVPGEWWGKGEPIYIASQPCAPQTACGSRIKHVVFSNITAEAENGAVLFGSAGTPLTDIELNDIHLHMGAPPPAISAAVGGNLDLRWTASTPSEGIVKSEIPALYAKNVNSLSLKDVHIDWADGLPGYFTDGLRVENFNDLTINDFSGKQAQLQTSTLTPPGAALALAYGIGVSITNSRALPSTHVFLQLDTVGDRRVFVNYDLSGATQALEPAHLIFNTQIGLPGAASIPKGGPQQ